jgi:hypothetical protein
VKYALVPNAIKLWIEMYERVCQVANDCMNADEFGSTPTRSSFAS